jgi:hypothetical protein
MPTPPERRKRKVALDSEMKRTKEKMERKLKNFSKRTGNWKLIILTTCH